MNGTEGQRHDRTMLSNSVFFSGFGFWAVVQLDVAGSKSSTSTAGRGLLKAWGWEGTDGFEARCNWYTQRRVGTCEGRKARWARFAWQVGHVLLAAAREKPGVVRGT